MLARLPFRSKLMLVVSIPLLVLLVFAGFAMSARFDAMAAQDQVAEVSSPFAALGAVARDVSAEGVAAEHFARTRSADPEQARAAIERARATTDRSVEALRGSVGRLAGNVDDATKTSVTDFSRTLPAVLQMYRGAVDDHSLWIAYFPPIAHEALDRAQAIVRSIDDTDLAAGFETMLDARRQQVSLGDQAAALLYTIRQGVPDETGVLGNAWVSAIVDGRTALQRFTTEISPDARAAFDRAGAGQVIASPIQADAATGGLPAKLTAATADYEHWYSDQISRLDAGTRAVSRVVGDAAASQRSDVRSELLLVVGGTALLLGGVLVLSWVLVRSVSKPLRALTRAARDVSERRLPRLIDSLHQGGELTADQLGELTPIKIDSQDEVGELAKAFSTVQQVTVAVAEEQSALLKKGIGDLYVNLARRNQSLLDRQISLLDDMEARVDEPDQLGALFELDHLATRMRRNAESLLVLSGAEQPRQWGTAVPLLDVARGAAAEIADFARISYFGFDGDIAVSGSAVADVSHLLAELLENAAVFSPPTAPVVVAGRPIDQRFVITITDEGIGMTDERLATANALLARPPAPGLSLSRTLGLYVVAHLAARHGIHVQLRHAPGTGLTAVVALPTSVLASAGESTASPGRSRATPGPSTGTEAPARPEMVEPMPAATTAGAPVAAGTVAWQHATAEGGLAHRVPTAGNGGGAEAVGKGTGQGNGNGGAPRGSERLASRTPGTNLTYEPGVGAPSRASEVRPRPERVAELLNRHERGKHDGRTRPRSVTDPATEDWP